MSNWGISEVDIKPNFQTNLSIVIIDSDNYSDENTIPVQIVRNNSYIRETIFDNVEKNVTMFQKSLMIVFSTLHHWKKVLWTIANENVIGDMPNQVK